MRTNLTGAWGSRAVLATSLAAGAADPMAPSAACATLDMRVNEL